MIFLYTYYIIISLSLSRTYIAQLLHTLEHDPIPREGAGVEKRREVARRGRALNGKDRNLRQEAQGCVVNISINLYICLSIGNKREVTHTNTRQEQHHTTHDKNNTTHDHTKNHPPHLTTIAGGAATVRPLSICKYIDVSKQRSEVARRGRALNGKDWNLRQSGKVVCVHPR